MIEHGRVPPQATDIEEALLGTMMMFPDNSVLAIKELEPEAFYKEAHQIIFAAIKKLNSESSQIDMLIVINELTKQKKLELVGGAYFVSKITNVTTNRIDEYVKAVKERYIKRIYIQKCNEIEMLAYDDSIDIFDLQGISNNLFEKINEVVASGGNLQHISTAVNKAKEELQKRIEANNTGEAQGVDTGLLLLNKITNGWQNSDLIILAARPGMGKTAMLLEFANVAAKQGKSVCVYSLEMSSTRLSDRMILKISDVDADNYRSGNLSVNEFEAVERATNYIDSLQIYIDDNPIVNMDYIKANSRVMKQQNKCDFILIDYLQLAEMDKAQSREQEVAKASRKAKIIAKELDVPVMLLSQLSRAVETRGGLKKPNLSDLRDSGAIEQDADMVLFLYRPEYYGFFEDENQNSTKGYGEILIEKHRNGALGTIPFKYNESLTVINDYTSIDAVMADSDGDKPF